MSAATALKKISAEVKRLRKKHPKAKYSSLQKKAGKLFREGKLKRIGSSGNTRTATKASTSRNRTATKTITSHIKVGAVRKKRKSAKRKVGAVRVIRRTIIEMPQKKRRRAHKVVRAVRRRRVGSTVSGAKSLLMPVLLIGGALLAYELLKPKAAVPVLAARATPAAAANQTSILQYATAIGLTGTALSNLINSLNSQNDNTVSQLNPASYVQGIQYSTPTSTVTAPDASSGSITFLNT
jgi:hypothetical protein